MFKRIISLCIIAAIFLSITACKGKSKTSDNNVSGNSSTIMDSTGNSGNSNESTATEAVNEDAFILPDANIRPIAVMIDNEGYKPLPQGGLNKAQLIYEIIVEGGATRIMPLFWNTDVKLLGPVRSARDYFLNYAIENNAIYVHFGGSPQAYADLKRLKYNDIDGIKGRDGALFWDLTNEGKSNWQDSYTSMEKLNNQISKLKFKTTASKKMIFTYNNEDTEPKNSQSANKVAIKYSSDYSCGFTYDPQKKLYLRIRKDKPQIERSTSKQLTSKNIIIQRVKNVSIAGDDKGRQKVSDTGKGDGWYITNGKAIELKWKKLSSQAQTEYYDKAGNPIVLNKGQTWVQIVPLSGKVTIE